MGEYAFAYAYLARLHGCVAFGILCCVVLCCVVNCVCVCVCVCVCACSVHWNASASTCVSYSRVRAHRHAQACLLTNNLLSNERALNLCWNLPFLAEMSMKVLEYDQWNHSLAPAGDDLYNQVVAHAP